MSSAIVAPRVSRRGESAMPKRVLKDEQTITALLEGTPVGVLATCAGDQPWAVPMNFVYDAAARRVYLHAAPTGRKLANIQANPKVRFLVYVPGKLVRGETPCRFGQRYQSVILSGRARVVSDPAEKQTALSRLVAKFAEGRELGPIPAAELNRVAVLAIDVEDVSGKENVD